MNYVSTENRYQKHTKPKLPEAAVTGPGLGLALLPRHPELTNSQAPTLQPGCTPRSPLPALTTHVVCELSRCPMTRCSTAINPV